MRKDEIRSRVRNSIAKIDTTNKYHDKFIDNIIEKAIIRLYDVEFKIDSRRLLRYCKRYGTITTIPVLQDLNANLYYSNYPEKIVNFPDKSSGVRRITTRQQGEIKFYPSDINEIELVIGGSYVDVITGKILYIPTLERIEFYDMTVAIAAVGIRADLVIPFSKYNDDDDVFIPEIKDEQGNYFDDIVLKILKEINSPDLIDDNADTVPIKEKGQ